MTQVPCLTYNELSVLAEDTLESRCALFTRVAARLYKAALLVLMLGLALEALAVVMYGTQFAVPLHCTGLVICLVTCVLMACSSGYRDSALELQPLSTREPDMCLELLALSKESPMVKTMVTAALAIPRQLRGFDLLLAKQLVQEEKEQRVKDAHHLVCKELHGVT